MIEAVFIGLFQAAAGEPQQPATPATQAQPAAAASQQTNAAPSQPVVDDDHTLRCRRQQVLGSRLGQRVCRTRAQEEQETEDSRRLVERLQKVRLPDGN